MNRSQLCLVALLTEIETKLVEFFCGKAEDIPHQHLVNTALDDQGDLPTLDRELRRALPCQRL